VSDLDADLYADLYGEEDGGAGGDASYRQNDEPAHAPAKTTTATPAMAAPPKPAPIATYTSDSKPTPAPAAQTPPPQRSAPIQPTFDTYSQPQQIAVAPLTGAQQGLPKPTYGQNPMNALGVQHRGVRPSDMKEEG
jgi:hypothetical protein